MARSIMLPPGVTDLVRATGQPITITAVEFDNNQPVGTSAHVVFLDGDQVRSAPLGDWPAAQAELAQKEADKQQAAQVKQQILAALQAMVGRPANGTYPAKELQALIMALVHKVGGINKAGEIRPPGEWL